MYGLDDYRAKQKIKEVKKKFLQEVDLSDSSTEELRGEDLTLDKFHAVSSSNSLFARRRLIITTNVLFSKSKNLADDLLKYLKEHQESDNIFIFYEPNLTRDKKDVLVMALADDDTKPLTKAQAALVDWWKQEATSQYFPLLNNQEVAVWMDGVVKPAGLELDYRAKQILTATVGSDLWALTNELAKLIHYQQASSSAKATEDKQCEDKIINAEAVLAMLGTKSEENIFALTDALSNKNKQLAVKLLADQLQEGASEAYLLTMLTRQVKILLTIRASLDSGCSARDIGAKVKLHPYVLQKGINQARNFNLPYLKSLLTALVRLDYSYKSGRLPASLMLSLIAAKI
jgi:DNA polymerase-3 subunit delta